jgi:hypothetical protein
MATRAAFLKRSDQPVAPAGGEAWASGRDAFQLRPLPSEDVYFYIKKIDNSRVVREADPAAFRRACRAGLKGAAVAALLICLLMPRAFEMVAGYRIHALAAEHARLVNQRAIVNLEEAQLRSPDRLQQLARDLHLVTPDPQKVVMLNNAKPDSALAMNVTR